MAKKDQKFLKFDDEEKNEIIERYLNGESSYQLAKEYGISSNTIKTWKYKIDHPEKMKFRKHCKLNENDLTKEDYKERYEILKKYLAFLKAQRERK